MHDRSLSHVWLLATLWTADQASLFMGFSRQEYWSRLPFPLSNPGMEPMSFALAGRFFTIEPPGKLQTTITRMQWLLGNLSPQDICVSLLFYILVSKWEKNSLKTLLQVLFKQMHIDRQGINGRTLDRASCDLSF